MGFATELMVMSASGRRIVRPVTTMTAVWAFVKRDDTQIPIPRLVFTNLKGMR